MTKNMAICTVIHSTYYKNAVRSFTSIRSVLACWLGVQRAPSLQKRPLNRWSTCIHIAFSAFTLLVASVKSRLVLPFWYRPTQVVPEKGPLNGCVCVCSDTVGWVSRRASSLQKRLSRKKRRLNRCNIHPFNSPLSGTTHVSRYQKGKTNLDFTEAKDSEWQWHQLGRTQVCTSLQTDNHASIPPLSFLQAGCPSCHPTNSIKILKASTASTIK